MSPRGGSRQAPSPARVPRHVRANRSSWNREADEYQREHASQLNHFDRPAWGVWEIPESRLDVLGDVRGLDVLEYGCGGGQWSISLARRGARPVGLDLSIRQLGHAQRLMSKAGAEFPIVNADAERTPFADASFDVVFCDHGAMTFADPRRTVPEVARVLRPGGLFAFNIASPLMWVCLGDDDDPPGAELRRDYFGMRRGDWDTTTEFQLPYGEWIRLFRSNGLEVVDLIELRPSRARTTYPDFAPFEWARRWPAENIWKLRREA
ncbi:MAG TPA: class I SAM-dependent methyltransferase [Actinomycetota bacterium]